MKQTWNVLLIVAVFLLSFVACGDDETKEEIPSNNDNYYVKYEVTNGMQVSYIKTSERNLRFKDVDKETSITVDGEWDGTYGPFKKGDHVYLYVSSNRAKYNANARLSVSKNKEAFTIKAEQRESMEMGLVYTIDY